MAAFKCAGSALDYARALQGNKPVRQRQELHQYAAHFCRLAFAARARGFLQWSHGMARYSRNDQAGVDLPKAKLDRESLRQALELFRYLRP
jgi:hypothetical protein